MNLNELETRPIANFLQVATLQSIAQAARAAGISQPAMTRQMQQLEQCLGSTLLKRRKYGVELTLAGRRFRETATEFLAQFNDILCHVKAEARAQSREIIVGCDSDSFIPLLTRAQTFAVCRNPDLQCTLKEFAQGDSVKALLDRRIDILATAEKPEQAAYESLYSEICQDRDSCLIVQENHPFAQFDSVSIEQLKSQPLIILNESVQPGLLSDLRDTFKTKKQRLIVNQIASAEITLLNYVYSGLGAGLVVGFTGNLDNTGMIAIPVSGLYIHKPRRIEILWRGAEDNDGLRELRETIVGEIRQNAQQVA
jgi:DNA-binding transcriptional LysR family regulator